MAELEKTAEGKKDIVHIDQKTETVKVSDPQWKVTMMHAIKMAVYSIVSAGIPLLIDAITANQNQYLILLAPAIAMGLRILEGYIRFHLTGQPMFINGKKL